MWTKPRFGNCLDIIGSNIPSTTVHQKLNRGYVPNREITKTARLSMTLRYLVGGDQLVIASIHKVLSFSTANQCWVCFRHLGTPMGKPSVSIRCLALSNARHSNQMQIRSYQFGYYSIWHTSSIQFPVNGGRRNVAANDIQQFPKRCFMKMMESFYVFKRSKNTNRTIDRKLVVWRWQIWQFKIRVNTHLLLATFTCLTTNGALKKM